MDAPSCVPMNAPRMDAPRMDAPRMDAPSSAAMDAPSCAQNCLGYDKNHGLMTVQCDLSFLLCFRRMLMLPKRK